MGFTAKDRLERLEKAIDNWVSTMFRQTAKMEKLNEQLAELQCEVIRLRRIVEPKSRSK
ncbi:oligoendopeptidase F family protein [Pleurocapsa sp. CCALA 161]|uniref:oligoendopeptidase F family protein n=1 Tax=Pleurocapsa sp. CCALA 161 TaxID=2107688 RepID=UPI0011B229C3|nr:oligoendopeptidase F family protein [Pleurocapsa sp. CCALA 161]